MFSCFLSYRGFVESLEVKMSLERVKAITCYKLSAQSILSWKIMDNVLPPESISDAEAVVDETFVVR